MTDVFISYAHEDQARVRPMVQALEAEGVSVWWDHTIPPGKTWDEVIARGIEQAKVCVVIWSKHSIGSDWVKEEATIAKDGRKYLPATIDGSEPPVGFRRIQAAQLSNWRGDRNDPQWRMLADEVVRAAAGAASATQAHRPRARAPAPKRSGGFSFGGVLFALLLAAGVGGGVYWFMGPGAQNKDDAALVQAQSPTTTDEPAPTTPEETDSPDSNAGAADASEDDARRQAELEQRRRDELEARRQKALEEQQRREQEAAAAATPASRTLGTWTNTDAETRSLTRIIVAQRGGEYVVRVYGKCHPTDCDWGTVNAEENRRGLRAVYDQGFAVKTLDIAVGRDGRLNFSVANHYTDNSGRADRVDSGTMAQR